MHQLSVRGLDEKQNTDYDLLERLRSENLARQGKYHTADDKENEAESVGCFTSFRRRFLRCLRDPRRLGFQHICLLLMVLAYTLLGALMFYLIESNYEQKMVTIRKAALDKTIKEIAEEMTISVNDPTRSVDVNFMIDYLQRAYITLLKQESAYVGSTFYKAEDMDHNLKWTFGSSFFFSMNVFTTTGYGSIAPESVLGKSCVIVYGFLFVPLTLVVIRHLGNLALIALTNIYAMAVVRWRKLRSRNPFEEGEVFSLPVYLCMTIMLTYLMATTTFIFLYDRLSGPPGSGIGYFFSFYFSFISISTIGLGDVMPNNVTFDPTITILFFFGMPLMKVVNSSTYQCVEKATIGIITLMENHFASLWHGRQVADISAEAPRPGTITFAEEDVSPPLQDEPRNDLTIRSVLTFIKSDAHVYGHRFGRVNLTARKETV